jgi:hypothetical protein
MPRGTPQSLFSTEPVSRNGLSLARNGCSLSEASIPGSKVLACYFDDPPSRLTARSAFCSPAFTGLPQLRTGSSLGPVAALLAGSPGCFLCLHSPPGLLRPSGSKRSTDSAALRLTFRLRPISSRSPLPSISSVGRGSPFLDRYVSGGLLFLKPLGTFSTMIPSPFSVNEFCELRSRFSSAFIMPVSKWLHGISIGIIVDKTVPRGCVVVLRRSSRDRILRCSYRPTSASMSSRNSSAEACPTSTVRATR